MTTSQLRNSVNRSRLRRGFLLIPLLLLCFALAPMAQAVGPDTDGSIPGSNNGEGVGVLVSRTTGVWNTGTGFQALNHDTVGGNNTATGVRALFSNTIGNYNTANGVLALSSNISGVGNAATGYIALRSNGNGRWNTANGFQALYGNIAGSYNVAVGAWALANNTVSYNTAIGVQALYSNTGGNYNTANGFTALFSNTTGIQNTATGVRSLYDNTEGFQNTANGLDALHSNTTGNNNTADGWGALSANTSGSGNTALGAGAGSSVTTADNVICIRSPGANVSNSCFIDNIYGVNEGGTISAVYINSNGQLGTQPSPSSHRFKKEIKPMDQTSEAILALKPVTFHYKSDKTGTPQFGLIAEEVAEVNPDLVVRDENGEIYSVRYDAVNAMLLNEFLKEHRRVEEQEVAIARLKQDFGTKIAQQAKQIEALVATVKEQATQIEKVNAQIEVGNPVPRTVLNNR
jgi:hypothetical protein